MINRFSETLKKVMKEKKITQKQMAEDIGVVPMTVHNWVTNGGIRVVDALIVAEYLNVSVEYLLTGIKPEEKANEKVIDIYNQALTLRIKDYFKQQMDKVHGDSEMVDLVMEHSHEMLRLLESEE